MKDFSTMNQNELNEELKTIENDGIVVPALKTNAQKAEWLKDYYGTLDDLTGEESEGAGESNQPAQDDGTGVSGSDDTSGSATPKEDGNEGAELAGDAGSVSGEAAEPTEPEAEPVDSVNEETKPDTSSVASSGAEKQLEYYNNERVVKVENTLIHGRINKKILCGAAHYVISVEEYDKLLAQQ